MTARPGTQAIDRAAQLLVQVVESPQPPAVGELAADAGLPKSTTSRLVGALERPGPRPAARRPRPPAARAGAAPLRAAGRRADLVELAAADARALADADGRDDQPRGPRARSASSTSRSATAAHFVGVTNWVGRRVPHHVAANGKVLPRLRRGPLPDGSSSASRRARSSTAAQLEAELERVRRRGYATAVDELELGLAAVAAPVFGRRRGRRRAVASPGPTTRLTSERIEELAPLLIEHAAPPRLAAALGHRRPRSEVPHDPRRDPPGPLRQHARRQRARGEGARRRGPRGRHGPRVDALRRAHPVARGGRRALRARRLLRPGDADRRAGDAGRARHPPPAARRDRARSRSART